MNVALIGATGFTGTAILKELTDRGHEVIAIARNPDKISIKSHLIHPVAANVQDALEVARAVKGSDVVISAFNPGWMNPHIVEDIRTGFAAIQEGVKKSGVKRYIVIGGAGSLYIQPDLQVVDSPRFPDAYRAAAGAVRDYLNVIKKEDSLDWTFFSPAIMMNQENSGVRRGHYRLGLENPVRDENGLSILSVEDLAVVIVDEVEKPKHIKKRFTAAY
jgi:putative NADH-flavin reductase